MVLHPTETSFLDGTGCMQPIKRRSNIEGARKKAVGQKRMLVWRKMNQKRNFKVDGELRTKINRKENCTQFILVKRGREKKIKGNMSC